MDTILVVSVFFLFCVGVCKLVDSGRRMACPSCRESVNRKALVCPHCRSAIPKRR